MLHCCQPAELPLAAFQAPVVPVAVQVVGPVPRLVVGELRVQRDPARGAALAGLRGRVPVGVRERRPVVTAGCARLDEEVVPLGLGVVRRPERQRPAAGRHGDLAGEPLVGHVGDLRVHVLRPGVRIERTARLVPPRGGPALELREAIRRQDAARRDERRPAGGVAGEDGIVEAPRQPGERVVDAHRVERGAVDRDRRWGPPGSHPGSTGACRWCRHRRTRSRTGRGSVAGPCRPGAGCRRSRPWGRRAGARRCSCTAGRRSRPRAAPCRPR